VYLALILWHTLELDEFFQQQARYGYSRDHRPDCKQVCEGIEVQLVDSPDGQETFCAAVPRLQWCRIVEGPADMDGVGWFGKRGSDGA